MEYKQKLEELLLATAKQAASDLQLVLGLEIEVDARHA